jgi:hypothetical protein
VLATKSIVDGETRMRVYNLIRDITADAAPRPWRWRRRG